MVLREVGRPSFDTKGLEVICEEVLPERLVKAIVWLAEYYATALPVVLQCVLPRGVEKKRRGMVVKNLKQTFSENGAGAGPSLRAAAMSSLPLPSQMAKSPLKSASDFPITLNSAQKGVVEEILGSTSNTVLLHGITGSGKTNVYLELARRCLEGGKSVVVLVPEIALTSQLVEEFRGHFEDVVVMHSGQGEAERHRIWQEVITAERPLVVVGPRSALFAPVRELGLVIIDEAHEPAYTQDQSPKYSALRLAAVMAKTVLGTATPTIADYYLCQQKGAVVELNELAVKSDKVAVVKVVDLKDRGNFRKHRLISDKLLTSIQESLKRGKQTLIFHNRRGSAPMTVCDRCGWQALCPVCLLPMTLHADKFALLCHTCGRKMVVPTGCPECGNANVVHKGVGTKFLESELARLFPGARIARFDADTLPEKQMKNIYADVKSGKYDILIGTQGIAKGFDFPQLATVGVVQADTQLALPDFSSEERTYQLLAQVIGRARRGHQDSEIFIQSYQPEHPAIVSAVARDYMGFYEYAKRMRQKSALPPYVFLLKLSVTYKTEVVALRNIAGLREEVMGLTSKVAISAPMPAFHERTPRGFCWQIVVKSKSRGELLKVLTGLKPNPNMQSYLDPPSLL
jgi:primosomal protein N' (replication factor Y)